MISIHLQRYRLIAGRFGAAAFVFFLIKGLAWLCLPWVIAYVL